MLSRACRPARSANAGCPRDSSRSTAPPHLPSGISPTHHRIISIVPDTNKRAWVPSCFVAFVRRGSTRSLTNGGSNIAATQASRSRHKQLIDDLLDPRNELERRVAKRTELRDGNARRAEALVERTALEQRTERVAAQVDQRREGRTASCRWRTHDQMGQHCLTAVGSRSGASDPAREALLQEQLHNRAKRPQTDT